MGARQSKRSVDITTTPKKGDGESLSVEGKVEKIEDVDVKVVTNGTVHTDIEFADKDEEVKETETEKSEVKITENGVSDSEAEKVPEIAEPATTAAAGDQPNESVAEASAEEKTNETATTEKVEETPESKKIKEKTKKKKWSLRSISFSKKDKSKPAKDEKNGDVKEITVEEKPDENETSAPEETIKEESALELTNGDASKEELTEEKAEEVKPAEEPKPAAELEPQAKVAEPIASPIKEETKVEEPKPVEEPPKIEAEPLKCVVADAPAPVVEDSKEVGSSEEAPPPLPSSQPPSQVTVFAESTKADLIDQIPPPALEPETVSSLSLIESEPSLPSEQSSKIAFTQSVESSTVSSPLPLIENVTLIADKDKSIESVVLSPLPVIENVIIDKDESVVSDKAENVVFVSPQAEKILESVIQDSSNVIAVEDDIKSLAKDSSLQQVSEPAIEDGSHVVSQEISKDDIEPQAEAVLDPTQVEIKTDDTLKLCEVSSDVNLLEKESNPLLPVTETPSATSNEQTKLPEHEDLPPPPPVPETNGISDKKADSIPDISTESLPSLPEPCSDSLPEPMSLPPLDSVPEPIANLPSDDTNKSDLSPLVKNPESSLIESSSPVTMTNGRATNGHSSPTTDEAERDRSTTIRPDGPIIKQVPTEITTVGDCEVSQNAGDSVSAVGDSTVATVE